MRALVQRVSSAAVRVDGAVVGEIGPGLLVLVGVARGDTAAQVDAAALVVSQFTLYGDPRKGRRPSWSAAAGGTEAEPLVEAFVARLRERGTHVATGVFGADMQVELINDGPVTVLVEL